MEKLIVSVYVLRGLCPGDECCRSKNFRRMRVCQSAERLVRGYDLFARHASRVRTNVRSFDLAFAIPSGYVGVIKSRSSMALRCLDVEAGVIDSDYRGNVQVLLHNCSAQPIAVDKGSKIAQLLVLPVFDGKVCEWEDLPDTERGEGGFGSTGR